MRKLPAQLRTMWAFGSVSMYVYDYFILVSSTRKMRRNSHKQVFTYDVDLQGHDWLEYKISA